MIYFTVLIITYTHSPRFFVAVPFPSKVYKDNSTINSVRIAHTVELIKMQSRFLYQTKLLCPQNQTIPKILLLANDYCITHKNRFDNNNAIRNPWSCTCATSSQTFKTLIIHSVGNHEQLTIFSTDLRFVILRLRDRRKLQFSLDAW